MHNNIISLILQKSKEFSNNKCIVYGSTSINYKSLHDQILLISYAIKRIFYENYNQSIKNNDLIAICIDQNLSLLPTILGILKTGAAYLPIDPNLPLERIKYILNDSKATICITKTNMMSYIQNLNLSTLLIDQECLEQVKNNVLYAEEADSLHNLSLDSLAYVIYTSGSTGNPKGVAIEHKNLFNLVQYQINYFEIAYNSRVLGFANISFDASVWEYFATMAAGGVLILTDKNSILPGEKLEHTIQKHHVTHVTLPPSALAVTCPIKLTSLSIVVSAGEKLTSNIAKKWSGHSFKFYNAYGPTETTVCASICEVQVNSLAPVIGKSFANSVLYPLTDTMELANLVGQISELYIGGPGVARGYLTNIELNIKSFVKLPKLTNHVLYKTGDIVRLNKNGDLEYIGRVDNQVKIRGYRIELEEIENHINSLIGVLFCAVIKNDDSLLAFIMHKNGKEKLTAEMLRIVLKEKLPDYMVPNHFIFLARMPQTHNGKIDRDKLLDQFSKSKKNISRKLKNLSTTEKSIIDICCEILQTKKITINDNFFEIGGHSLLITKVILSIRANLNVNITINQFVEANSFKDLAIKIDEMRQII